MLIASGHRDANEDVAASQYVMRMEPDAARWRPCPDPDGTSKILVPGAILG